MADFSKLFEPWHIGTCEIPNRIALTPMLLEVAEFDGTAGDRCVEYYTERAKGGVGLIETEVTRISDWTGCTGPAQLSVTSDRCIPGLTRLADSVHAQGSKIFVQLHHPGRQTYQLVVTAWKLSDFVGRHWDGWWNLFFGLTKYMDFFDQQAMHKFYFPTVSASNVPNKGLCSPVEQWQKVRPLTKWEIHYIEDEFARGALRCKKAGIDGVQLHCAHGYFLQQFISPYTNRREDEYGGSLENRLRIVKEIIDKIHELCGPDYPISARLTVDEYYRMFGYDQGIVLSEGIEVAKLLESYGVQFLDLSCGTYECMNAWCEPTSFDLGWRKENGKAVKEAVSIPVGHTGVIRTPEQAEKLLEEGYQDVIGLGRPLLADPHWARKAKEGRSNEINRCISCLYCLESMMHNALQGGKPGQCAVNPRTCNEVDFPYEPRKTGMGRQVVVVGAGPAGLMAARTCAQKGFNVTVFEKNQKVGGQILLAAAPKQKYKIGWCTEDLKTQCDVLGVKFNLGCEATAENVSALKPYVVFNAVGGVPVTPKIPGYDLPNVYTPNQILDGSVNLQGKTVAVIGSGMTGLETAEYLSDMGNKIVIVEMADTLAPGTWVQHKMDVIPKLEDRGTKFFTGWKLTQMNPDSVLIEDVTVPGATRKVPCDAIIMSLGVRSAKLDDSVLAVCKKVITVGDADKTGRIGTATHQAYRATINLE